MELFGAASDLPSAERAAYLARECAGRADLLVTLQALLDSQSRAESEGFLRKTAMQHVASQAVREVTPGKHTGELFGRYRILQLLAEGGMGEVYLAEDTELNRRVALKLIKNAFNTSELLDRFEREGRILAHLNHDGIARLLDAGTSASGVPFLVMEYVDGKPITQHCNERALSVSARLELFRAACAAVQYAHQNVVVHRDLKPSNILVTNEGQVKLLDFGIAKLLDTAISIEATATLLRLLTPAYASPEQVKGEVTTTATDVYSLGVVLYELLTGSRPYSLKRGGSSDLIRAICEQEPRLPSSAAAAATESSGPAADFADPPAVARNEGGVARLRRRLRGDLDQIVLKALRKEPEARYATVEQFSSDIGRHLEGLPVVARRRTFRYQAVKFVQRNRVAVIAAAVVLFTLIGGIVATTWAARVAIAERVAAQKRFNEARKLAHAVLFDYHDAIASLPGSTPVREKLVSDALVYLNRMAQDAGGDTDLQLEVAEAYVRVGDVQGRPYAPNLGQTEAALVSYNKARAILDSILAKEAGNAAALRQSANALERIGAIQLRLFHFEESVDFQTRALVLRTRLAAAHPADNGLRHDLASSHLYLGDSLQAFCFKQRPPGFVECLNRSLAQQQQALDMFQQLAAANPFDFQTRREMAEAYMKVGFRHRDLANNLHDDSLLNKALENEQKAMQIRREVAAANPTSARDLRNVADQRMLLGNAQLAVGDVASAIAGYRESIVTFRALSEGDPQNAEARRDLGFAHVKLGKALTMTGQWSAAFEEYAAALACVKSTLADDPTNAEDHQQLAAINLYESEAETTLGNAAQAVFYYNAYLAETTRDCFGLNQLGLLNVQAAQSPKTLAGDRRRYWEAARDTFRRALDWIGQHPSDEHAQAAIPAISRSLAGADAALRR